MNEQKKVVFTRTAHLDGEHVNRALLVEIAKERGYQVQSMVTVGTTLLVTDVWPVPNPTRKSRAAEKYGTRVVSPAQFLAQLSK